MIECGLTLNEYVEALRKLPIFISKRYYTDKIDISDYCNYTENDPNDPNVLECKDKMINEI